MVVCAVLWIVSFLRVAAGLIGQETFGAEPTVAFLIVVLLPVLLREALWRLVARRLRSHMHREQFEADRSVTARRSSNCN
jgi:uncharacterized membrane protein